MDGLILTGVRDALVIPPAFDWPAPDRILEAIGTGTARRAQRANAAATDVIRDRFQLEKDTQQQILKRLAQLKQALGRRLLADGGGVTDFKRFTLNALTADVDRLVTDTQVGLAAIAEKDYARADELGVQAVQEPLEAAQLQITRALPGLDRPLVAAAFGNTVDLLTTPMQQYATQVKVAIRGVALAGDNKFGAIQKLQKEIEGGGFDNAQYRAERIIRTELGRVFNQATFDRLVVLSKDFPFLRKGWRSTADKRTRIGHRQAGQTYGRGNGIPITARFQLQVYDERPGKGAKLLGVATLLFPVDPGATPQGRLAAAATIMCRCNGFVDFNLSDFADFTRAKVSTALSGAKPEPAPKPTPVPGDDLSLAKSLKGSTSYYKGTFFGTKADMQAILDKLGRSGAQLVQGVPGRKIAGGPDKQWWRIVDGSGASFGPTGWKMPATPKVAVPKVAVPKRAHVTPAPTPKTGPVGPKVSASADLTPANPGYKRKALAAPMQAKVRAALDVIDSVHGDGNLQAIPVTQIPAKYRRRAAAFYEHTRDGRPLSLGFGTGDFVKAAPKMTVFHEVGHWLDNQGVGARADASTAAFATQVAGGRPEVLAAVERWRDAVKNTQAIQTLRKWQGANIPVGQGFNGVQGNGHSYGDGTVPSGVSQQHVNYLLRTNEVWARSYAQYVATTSGDKGALAELRNMQAASATALQPVAKSTPFSGTQLGRAPKPGSWDYPWQWGDEDFKPVQAAFDNLMQVLGWRR